jgi:hypothetical protein
LCGAADITAFGASENRALLQNPRWLEKRIEHSLDGAHDDRAQLLVARAHEHLEMR